jgi:hypothetical protein
LRCNALCEQKRLRNSALTAGKQLKRLAPLRAKTTSSRAHRPPFIEYQRPRWACGAPHRIGSAHTRHHEKDIWHSVGRNVAIRTNAQQCCREDTPTASFLEHRESDAKARRAYPPRLRLTSSGAGAGPALGPTTVAGLNLGLQILGWAGSHPALAFSTASGWHSRRRVHRKASRWMMHPERFNVGAQRRRHGALRRSNGLHRDGSLPHI